MDGIERSFFIIWSVSAFKMLGSNVSHLWPFCLFLFFSKLMGLLPHWSTGIASDNICAVLIWRIIIHTEKFSCANVWRNSRPSFWSSIYSGALFTSLIVAKSGVWVAICFVTLCILKENLFKLFRLLYVVLLAHSTHWNSTILKSYKLQLNVRRQHQHYFAIPNA